MPRDCNAENSNIFSFATLLFLQDEDPVRTATIIQFLIKSQSQVEIPDRHI